MRKQALLMNFKSKKWTVLLLIFLIILAIGIFIQFSLGLGVFRSDLKSFFVNTFSQSPFGRQSQINVSTTDSSLKMSFEIIDSDKPVFGNFVRNWFGTNEEIKTLDLNLDKNLIEIISSVLPAKLSLKVTDKSLEFRNQVVPGLQTSITGTDINFATGSGKLQLKYVSPSQYRLYIMNPNDLAFYATSSGMLTASSKIDGLFKSLPQVATIELSVSGKNITGSIRLK